MRPASIFFNIQLSNSRAANILFDNRITQWTHPESVPVLAETGTKRLIAAMEISE